MQTINFYITAGKDTFWSVHASENPSDPTGEKLVSEQTYPVELYYYRTDINGSGIYESFKCANREELLESLNWLGTCGWSILKLWDFDENTVLSPGLSSIFEETCTRRISMILEEDPWWSFEPPAEERCEELDKIIQAAASRAKTARTANSPEKQRIEPDRLPF